MEVTNEEENAEGEEDAVGILNEEANEESTNPDDYQNKPDQEIAVQAEEDIGASEEHEEVMRNEEENADSQGESGTGERGTTSSDGISLLIFKKFHKSIIKIHFYIF